MTAFPAKLLTLMASLPLLLPTGVCLCDAGLERCAKTAVVGDADSHDCCSDCQGSDDAMPAHPESGDDHSPSCPKEKHEVSPLTKTMSSLTVDFVPTAVSQIAAPIDVGSPATTTHVGASYWPSAPPRYVSHCSLLF